MTGIFESPVQIAVIGVIFTAILAGGWIQTGLRPLLYGAVAVALLAIGLFVAERLIVTDRESVEMTLYQIAKDVEANDPDRVLRHIHSTQSETIAKVRSELPKYVITSLRVTRIHEIRLFPEHIPPQAICEFNVVASGHFGSFGADQSVPRFVVLTFQKEDGVWKVADYEHHEAMQGFLERR